MNKKVLKIIGGLAGAGITVGLSVAYYMFNAPHRDVQAASADYAINASAIVAEYLADSNTANEKYLDSEGESKVLEINGTVKSITEDFNAQKVVLLQSETDEAGVSCTFTATTNAETNGISVGQNVSVKGVIRSGAAYDEDIEMYEHVILEKCTIIQS